MVYTITVLNPHRDQFFGTSNARSGRFMDSLAEHLMASEGHLVTKTRLRRRSS